MAKISLMFWVWHTFWSLSTIGIAIISNRFSDFEVMVLLLMATLGLMVNHWSSYGKN